MANEAGQITLIPLIVVDGKASWVTDVFKFNAAFPKVLTIQSVFTYGSGGDTLKVYVQTSIDNGATWTDVVCVANAMANKSAMASVNNFTFSGANVVTPSDGALADNTVQNGILGNRIRVKVTKGGGAAYADSTKLTVLATVR